MLEKNDYIYGIRAVIEAAEAGKEFDKVLISNTLQSALAPELMTALKSRGILIQKVPVEKIDRITRRNHQGVLAILSAVSYCSLATLVPTLFEEGKTPLIVMLDGVTDVRNFGAIARTCECAGVDAMVIARRGGASVTADAMKTSAGALAYLPICRENSIINAVKFLRDCGFQIVAATEKSDIPYTRADFTLPTAIVMGAEDTGISEDVLRFSTARVAIPERGHISSLNVSVAAGVMIYEAVRQRTI
jgi:RNA methyltransferase, trmH family, group 3